MDVRDLKMSDGSSIIEYLKDNAFDKGIKMDKWTEGYETCKSRLYKIILDQIEADIND